MVDFYLDEGRLFFQVSEDLTFLNITEFISVFEEVVENKKTYEVFIDAGKLSMLDSAALNALAHQAKRLHQEGGVMCMYEAPPAVLDSIRTTRLDKLIKLFPTREEALEAVAGPT